MKMKTSSRIALQFTLWIALISGALLILLNSMFLVGWLRSETQDLAQYMVLKDVQPRNPITDTLQRREKIVAINPTNFNPQQYNSFRGIERIRFFSDRRWIVGQNDKYFMILDVSQNVNRQIGLVTLSGALRIGVIILSYFLGRLFVRKSLRDLRMLAQKLHQREISITNKSLLAEHLPKDDEINAIAYAIESLEKRVYSHYNKLRMFVGHASHELKTPLMVMRSDVDLASRTKEYDELISNIRESISNMQNITETLLLLTRLQSQDTIQKEETDVVEMIDSLASSIQKKYTAKNISYSIKSPEKVLISANIEFAKILFINILDNARKYTDTLSKIQVTISEKEIRISNQGSLSEDTINNMRDPFRQADKNRTDGIGIGLSLVQQIAYLHGWKVSYTSGEGLVTCIVSFI